MVMMFPYAGHSPAAFNFSGSIVLAKSSDDVVHDVHVSHSTIDNRSSASLHLMFDSEGFNFNYITANL